MSYMLKYAFLKKYENELNHAHETKGQWNSNVCSIVLWF